MLNLNNTIDCSNSQYTKLPFRSTKQLYLVTSLEQQLFSTVKYTYTYQHIFKIILQVIFFARKLRCQFQFDKLIEFL